MPARRPKVKHATPSVRHDEETQRLYKDAESALLPEKSTPTRRLEFEPASRSASHSTGDSALLSAMHACEGNLAAFLSTRPYTAVPQDPLLVLAADESESQRLIAPPPGHFGTGTYDDETEERDIIRAAADRGDEELFPGEDPLPLLVTPLPLTLAVQDISPQRSAMHTALPETLDDGCAKVDAEVVLGSCGTVLSEHRHDEVFIPPPLVHVSYANIDNNKHTLNGEEEEEEDAPLFPKSSSSKGHWGDENGATGTGRAACFAVGMRVEAQWGRRWFPATVTEANRKGYVQVRWDEDGSLLHLRTREVRHVAPALTATQLVELMNEEDEKAKPSGHKEHRYEQIVLYLSPAARSRLSDDRFIPIGREVNGVGIGIVDAIKARGAFVANSLDAVESAIASNPQALLWFVVSNDSSGDDEMAVAHAMGVAALGVDWLERLSAMGTAALDTPPTPTTRDSVGYNHIHNNNNIHKKNKNKSGGCTPACCRPLPRAERFLYGKIVYVAGAKDKSVAALLTACGACVTHAPPSIATRHVPHYVYVAPGTRAHIEPCVASVALLEREWLLHRIREFFLSLPAVAGTCDGSASHCSPAPPLLLPPPIAPPTPPTGTGPSLPTGTGPSLPTGTGPSLPTGTGPSLPTGTGPSLPTGTGLCSPLGRSAKRPRSRSHSPARREGSRVLVAAAGERLDVVEGEDYYFRAAPSPRGGREEREGEREREGRGRGVAADVVLGRVVHVKSGAAHVTLRLYEVKRTALRQNARTGDVERQTIVYLSDRVATVPVEDLIFETPVYVVNAAQMQHVYTLESPPRDDAEESGPRLSLCAYGPAALSEVFVNEWRICPGVDVWFYNPLSMLSERGRVDGGEMKQGRVQAIQRAANGVVLVVHAMKEAKGGGSGMADEVEIVVITPDMITGIV